jgi:hypothetical protein
MRKARGPFPELQGLSDMSDATPEEDLLERMDVVNVCLATHGCNCNGHVRGNQRDEYFGGDLSELVSRCIPHEIDGPDDPETGQPTKVMAHVRIETLTVEVDENDEVCVWIYEES